MTDRELLENKLAFIETRVSELRRLVRPELIESDIHEERFVAHTLQLASQAALDIASHIVSDERLGEPESNRDLFRLLQSDGWLPAELTSALANMAGFRNLVVYGYERVDLRILRDIAEHRQDDLLAFTRQRLGA